LTGFIREEGAKEDIRVELGRLTGGRRNLQIEEIRDLYRCPKIILFMKMLKECYVRVVCSDGRKGSCVLQFGGENCGKGTIGKT